MGAQFNCSKRIDKHQEPYFFPLYVTTAPVLFGLTRYTIFLSWHYSPSGPRPPLWDCSMTFRHTTLGRTPLNERSARRRHLYLTTHNSSKRQTSMPPMGFELTIPTNERPQTYALDRAATGVNMYYCMKKTWRNLSSWTTARNLNDSSAYKCY